MAPIADGDNTCMICRAKPSESESLVCNLYAMSWHVSCLFVPPETMASAAAWECPNYSGPSVTATNVVSSRVSLGLIASLRAIEADGSLTKLEKAGVAWRWSEGRLMLGMSF